MITVFRIFFNSDEYACHWRWWISNLNLWSPLWSLSRKGLFSTTNLLSHKTFIFFIASLINRDISTYCWVIGKEMTRHGYVATVIQHLSFRMRYKYPLSERPCLLQDFQAEQASNQSSVSLSVFPSPFYKLCYIINNYADKFKN